MRPDNFSHVSNRVIMRECLHSREAAAIYGGWRVRQNTAINFTIGLRENGFGYGPFHGVRCHAAPCF